MDKNNFEDGVVSGSGGSSFDFLNIDTKLKEISEKCSQLKSEAEQSISRLEMADEAKEEEERGDNKEDFSVSQTEAQIEYSRRWVSLKSMIHDGALATVHYSKQGGHIPHVLHRTFLVYFMIDSRPFMGVNRWHARTHVHNSLTLETKA